MTQIMTQDVNMSEYNKFQKELAEAHLLLVRVRSNLHTTLAR